jgi:hypothetical protein
VNEIEPGGVDARLAAQFRGLNTSLEGERFSAGVMRRIQRRVVVRRLVLGTATVAGTAIASLPFAKLLSWISAALLATSVQSWSLVLIDSLQAPLVLLALVVSGICALNWLAR